MERIKRKYWYLIVSLVIIILFFPLSIREMSMSVLKDAQLIGEKNAKVFALNEVLYTKQYETIISTLEYQLRPENRTDTCVTLMERYLKFVDDTMNLKSLKVYASIDEKIQSPTYREDDVAAINPLEREWYQKAIEADGKIIYTDVYSDAVLNTNVVTLAKKIKGTQDVVGVDIYVGNIVSQHEFNELPEGSNHFLCDSKGVLLENSIGDVSEEEVQEQIYRIFTQIEEGKYEDYDSSLIGIDGRESGVYYYQLDSGWYSVVTIPYDELLKGVISSWRIFLGVVGLSLAMLIVFVITDYRANRKVKISNDIIGVLGNLYYSIYLINLENGKYQMLKGEDDVCKHLPGKADYGVLVEALRTVIAEEDSQQFFETFSIENMRKLIKNRGGDFGGDFKRLFGGQYRWVHVQMLYDESFQDNSIVLCFKDIDREKEQDLLRMELLKNSLESVDRMAKSKSVFFSQMSHDMRTPLNGIIGLSNLIQRNPDDKEKRTESLKKITMLSNQLLSLIDDILNMSKMEQREIQLKNESFDIKKNLEDLISIFRIQAESEGKAFVTEINIEDSYIISDWGKIQQILNNLLSNAFKFTKREGKIELSVSETKDYNSKYRKYCFKVKDNGAGMSQEFLKKIFIPFERETQFGAASVSGTGLGMSIVYELVHKLNGTINIESEIGKGSSIDVMISCLVSEETGKVNVEAKEEKENNLSDIRILLAEDNEINMEITTEILKECGMTVVQAWNGKEAVEVFENYPDGYFDFILMDMQMPIMDGCEAAKRIRQSKKKDGQHIPIIAVTANAFVEDIVLTKKAGMNAHISKPIDFEVLKDIMSKFI